MSRGIDDSSKIFGAGLRRLTSPFILCSRLSEGKRIEFTARSTTCLQQNRLNQTRSRSRIREKKRIKPQLPVFDEIALEEFCWNPSVLCPLFGRCVLPVSRRELAIEFREEFEGCIAHSAILVSEPFDKLLQDGIVDQRRVLEENLTQRHDRVLSVFRRDVPQSTLEVSF